MKKLKVAVIGCGSISVMHLTSADKLDSAEIVAVCDIKEERARAAAEKYSVPSWYTDYHKMLEAEELDAVHICTPHYLHVPISTDAMKKGINVLCEKPMSIKYGDAVKAVECAKEYGVSYGVIFQCRYNEPSRAVKERIADGRLGKVKCARVTLTWSRDDGYYGKSDWKGTWDKEGGGVVIDQAIHSLDLANWFIDDTPISVSASLHNRNHAIMKVEDTAEGFIKYSSGQTLSFWAMNNYAIDEPIEIRLLCENGKARLSYDTAIIDYNDKSIKSEQINTAKLSEVKFEGGKSYWGTRHLLQINNFYNSLLGKEPLDISGSEALKIQKIVCDIYANNDSPLK